jgi:hypothetical protein
LCFFKRRKISRRGNTKFLNYGYSDGFFSLKVEGGENNSNIHGGINENRLGSSDVSNQGFEKLTGADADKFTLAGNKLTFIAKAFEAGSEKIPRFLSHLC